MVFVYGSLRRGERHHAELEGARYAGVCRTAPRYRLRSLGQYPALELHGDESVDGELYEVDAVLLVRLDEFEGCPELYQRAEVMLDDGRVVQAYVVSGGRSG